ncbi:MAG: hypothetical protein Kow0088_23150 [Anaerolineales bacterium]
MRGMTLWVVNTLYGVRMSPGTSLPYKTAMGSITAWLVKTKEKVSENSWIDKFTSLW